jgi:tetratricopeptide (TPR) repeat protein
MENDNKEAEAYEAFKSGDLLKGIEIFEELLDQSSRNSNNISELSKTLYGDCKSKYLNYPDSNITEDLLERWASLLFRVKNYMDGLEILGYILKNINEKNEYVWFKRGSILTTRLDLNEEALSCFEKALTINPQFKKALEFKATLLFELDRLKEALQCFDRVLQLEPENCNALETKGEIYETLGQLDKAMECYMKALNVRTGSEKAEKLKVQIEQLRSQLALRNVQKGGMHTFQPVHTATKPQMNVIIAGASINGLMFALLCHQKRTNVQIFDLEGGSSYENNTNVTFIDSDAMQLIKEYYLFEELFKRQDGQSEGYLYYKQKRGTVPTKHLKDQLMKQCQKRGIMINTDYSIAVITKKALVFKDNKTEDLTTVNAFDLIVDCTRNKILVQELNKQRIISMDNIKTDLITINYVFKLKKTGLATSAAAESREEEVILWEKACNASSIITINGKPKIFAVECLRTKSHLEVKVTSAASKSIDSLIDKNKHRELGIDAIKSIFGADIKLLENGSSTKPIQVTICPTILKFKPSIGKWQKERSKTYWAIIDDGTPTFHLAKDLHECIIDQEIDEKKFDKLAVNLPLE